MNGAPVLGTRKCRPTIMLNIPRTNLQTVVSSDKHHSHDFLFSLKELRMTHLNGLASQYKYAFKSVMLLVCSPLAVVKVVVMDVLCRLSFWLRALTVYRVPLCSPFRWCSTEVPDTITVTVTLGAAESVEREKTKQNKKQRKRLYYHCTIDVACRTHYAL